MKRYLLLLLTAFFCSFAQSEESAISTVEYFHAAFADAVTTRDTTPFEGILSYELIEEFNQAMTTYVGKDCEADWIPLDKFNYTAAVNEGSAVVISTGMWWSFKSCGEDAFGGKVSARNTNFYLRWEQDHWVIYKIDQEDQSYASGGSNESNEVGPEIDDFQEMSNSEVIFGDYESFMIEAYETADPSGLENLVSPELYQIHLDNINDLRARGCYWSVTVKSPTVFFSEVSAEGGYTEATRDWKVVELCKGSKEVIRDEPSLVFYEFEPTSNDGYVITSAYLQE